MSETNSTPPELMELANAVIPEKSKKLYEDSYNRFVKFCEEEQAADFSENVLLSYFFKLSKQHKSSTLWSNFSMIKAELNVRHNVNLNTYAKLIAFLKLNSKGYKAKKSKVLTKEQFDEFLLNAPDSVYLATKVMLIFGITGACRCDELLNLTVNDITDLGNSILVKINNRTNESRSFTITGDFYIKLYRNYAALRPKDMNTARFFIKYRTNKCHRVVMGRHKIARTAMDVASFLQLPNPSEYTGHCLRKTSATLSLDNGENISALQRLRGAKSATVAEGQPEEDEPAIKETEEADCEIKKEDDDILIKEEIVDYESEDEEIKDILAENSDSWEDFSLIKEENHEEEFDEPSFITNSELRDIQSKMDWPYALIMQFLDYYEAEPALWDPSSPQHKHRQEIFDAWKRIEEKMGHVYSVYELKRKKDSLMASFRGYYRKVKRSAETATSTEVYKPNWFAYERMASFLKDKVQTQGTMNAEKMDKNNTDDWVRKRQLANARMRKYRLRKRFLCTDKQNEPKTDVIKNLINQETDEKVQLRKELARERSKRYRDRKRTNALKTVDHLIHDSEIPGPSHANPPFLTKDQSTRIHDFQNAEPPPLIYF